MSEIVLSIVVAAFNVERFIERCVISICTQRLEGRVEVIVVDDGSTDGTGEILRNLVARHTDLHVIHQANHGVGAARNLGNEHARGRYVWFVDGDDFLKDGAMGRMLEILVRDVPDLLAIDFSCSDEGGFPIQWIHTPFQENAGTCMRGGEFFARHFATTFTFIYVVKRSLLVDHGLRFQPRIKMQDAELMPRILAVAGKVLISRIDAYVYVKRAGSYMNSSSAAAREESFLSVLEVRRRLQAFRESVCDLDMLAGLASKLDSIRGILLMALVYDQLDRASLRQRLDLLKADGLYPFGPLPGESIKTRLIRNSANLWPILFPPMYRVARKTLNAFRATGIARTEVRS